MMEELLTVDRLGDFINILNDYPSTKYFYRGENRDYSNRIASAFRKNNESINFVKLREKFYTTIGHKLSDVEKEHFLAFSQHHGLPTSLIDVTSAPLIALFFACYEADEKGFVYIFDDIFIDVTDVLTEFSELKISFDEKSIIKMADLIYPIWRKPAFGDKDGLTIGDKYLWNLFHMLKTIGIMESLPDEAIIGRSVFHWEGNIEFWNNTFDTIDGVIHRSTRKLFDTLMKRERFLFRGIEAYSILLAVANVLASRWGCYGAYNFIPNMIYRPKITFERARLQQGFFIYQLKFFTRVFQPIEHVLKVEINNPGVILNELDNIGINLGTVFGDYDNIARYIFEKARNNKKSS